MHNRFLQYLRFKKLSQRKLAELTRVSYSTVSRFCNGSPILSDKLLSVLQACDDLSLEWFFFGTGSMIRNHDRVTLNKGTFAGSDLSSDNSVNVSHSRDVKVNVPLGAQDLQFLLAEKDRLIAEKDRVISERDRSLSELYRLLSSR